jgi:pyruvate/2-oxoacid:ferredoxin oxidoreductase alpha subunit
MATEVKTKAKIATGRKVITGNYAASYGAALSRAQVIAAYPITPQTTIVELLADFCAEGALRAKFIKVESEHSAMASLIGASAAGARTFTATSAHGLALMHEMLHWAAGARLPIVMAEVNRAMGAPWSIWTDQNDSLAQRDTGWLQYYCESNQETLDTVIQAYKVAEQVSLPVMLVLDAFFLSHTSEAVEIPEQELVDRYLPPYRPKFKLDINDPRAFSGITMPGEYMEFRYKIQKAMEEAREVAREADLEFERMFGRDYGSVEPYMLEDAEVALVTSGTVTSTSRLVIGELRAEGVPVGLLKIRLFRPFPIAEVREHLASVKKIAVLDRNISFGYGGIFAQEIKSALYNYGLNGGPRPPVFGFVAGLGGRDVTPELIQEIIEYTLSHDRPEEEIIWMGVKR